MGGRSKWSKNTSLKSNTPVPFPHDGTVFCCLNKEKKDEEDEDEKKNDDTNTDVSSWTEAKNLLRLVENDTMNNDGTTQSSTVTTNKPSLEEVLCTTLKEATTVKGQLNALQLYRNSILNMRKKNRTHNNDNGTDVSKSISSSSAANERTINENEKVIQTQTKEGRNRNGRMIGLFRLLLEWSLSYQSSTPIQRAIQSNLKTIQEELNDNINNRNVVEEIYTIVIQSIFDANNENDDNNNEQQQEGVNVSKGNNCWYDPLYSIEIAANYHPLLEILQTELLYDCLSFLYTYKVSKFLEISGINETTLSEALMITDLLKRLLSKRSIPMSSSLSSSSSPSTTTTGTMTTATMTTTTTMKKDSKSQLELPYGKEYKHFILSLLEYPNMITEGYNTLGIVYGKLFLYLSSSSLSSSSSSSSSLRTNTTDDEKRTQMKMMMVAQNVIDLVQNLDTNDTNDDKEKYSKHLSTFARLSIVQGISATLDLDILTFKPTTTTTRPNTSGTTDPTMTTDSRTTVTTTTDTFSSTSTVRKNGNVVSPLTVCWKYSLYVCQTATDPMVRWGALKGLSTAANRWKQYMQQQQQQQQPTEKDQKIHQKQATKKELKLQKEGSFGNNPESESIMMIDKDNHNDANTNNDNGNTIDDELIQETLAVVLQAWENPPLRKLGTAIPGIFRSLVQILTKEQVRDLCQHVLDQPLNRKGRYLAMEILLPYMSSNNFGPSIDIDSLMEGIGDSGANTGPIADLWTKVLHHLLTELEATASSSSSSSEKGEQELQQQEAAEKDNEIFMKWMNIWIPSLGNALLDQQLSRRKQIADFCLPHLVKMMKSNKKWKPYTSSTFVTLFQYLNNKKQRRQEQINSINRNIITNTANANTAAADSADFMTVIDSSDTLQLYDRILWAQLEISRHATLYKLIGHENIRQVIASSLPIETFHSALTHSSACIRLVAFQATEPVVTSYSQTKGMDGEIDIWKYAFPYAARSTESNAYTVSLFRAFSNFLERLCTWEAKQQQQQQEQQEQQPVVLTRFYSFVSNFLIKDLFLKTAAYPGTVADKEGFSKALLECILSFITQNHAYCSDNYITRNDVIFNRRRSGSEITTMKRILSDLISKDVFSSLFAFLHSIWDNTRNMAFGLLSKLAVAAQANDLMLPVEYNNSDERRALFVRGVYLASSPRQREADTGSKILAYLYVSLDEDRKKFDYLSTLVDMLESRLSSMRDHLRRLLTDGNGKGVDDVGNDDDDDDDNNNKKHQNEDGLRLPLAHGIILAIRLTIEQNKIFPETDIAVEGKHNLYLHVLEVFSRAIQISLSVVADVREGEMVEGMDDELLVPSKSPSSSEQRVAGNGGRGSATPLNVNTGAIGANGTVSKLTGGDADEAMSRLAIQRVVIGSWLLTKETCACVAATISANGFEAPCDVVEKIGILLISTLTSLKHAGAAFAARDSLQDIANVCWKATKSKGQPSLRPLPTSWSKRLLGEISSNEKVRDSTLRRSTGYALGFLALMRSEVSSSVAAAASSQQQWTMCTNILEKILQYSLPPQQYVATYFDQLHATNKEETRKDPSEYFDTCGNSKADFFIPEREYESRCRVHALNILRLIILDAPLSDAVRPFVGDAIVSSILGYDDPSWAVRNSATMVFSAAMLRVVDPDKNASNVDKTSSNAITITEFFRRYPTLLEILPLVMNRSIERMSSTGQKDFNSQLFPILLLLSRVQPVSNSGGVATVTKRLVPAVLESLQSKDFSVRMAAARSLANLCSEHPEYDFTTSWAMLHCRKTIDQSFTPKKVDWNSVDGSLAAIYALVKSSDSSKITFMELSMDELLRKVLMQKQGDGKPKFPPSCMATALEILVHMSLQSADKIEYSTIIKLCADIVSLEDNFDGMIGGSTFYASTATSICKICENTLWESYSADDTSEFHSAIKVLKQCFTHQLIDVRLTAVKVFKKTIYGKIDALLASNDNKTKYPAKQERMASVTTMILECLDCEVRRSHSTLCASLGPHIPTVRRLSRCFLECTHCLMVLSGSSDGSLNGFLTDERTSLLWHIAQRILDMDSFLGDGEEHDDHEPNGETFQSSNAAELMSLVVSYDLSKSGGDIEHDDRVYRLADVIQRLNHQKASWRSRYSAAVALKNSNILQYNSNAPGGLRGKMLFQIVKMLQDSDIDVRAVAGQAANQVGVSTSGRHVIPEITLVDVYHQIYNIEEHDTTDTILSLQKAVVENCTDVVGNLHRLVDEFKHTGQASTIVDATSLLNVTSHRKIFEAEDPNPYHERTLVNQLAVKSLVGQTTQQDDTINKLLLPQLVTLTERCLQILIETAHRTNGTVHDLSWYPTIFPRLHGLLSTVAAMIYLGGQEGSDKIVALCREWLSMNGSTNGIHVGILACLEGVVAAATTAKDDDTKKSILNCLFLLTNKQIGK